MTGPAVLAGVGHCSDYRRPKEPSVDREARLSLYDQVTTNRPHREDSIAGSLGLTSILGRLN